MARSGVVGVQKKKRFAEAAFQKQREQEQSQVQGLCDCKEAQAPRPISGVDCAFSELGRQTQAIEEITEALEERIAPVCRHVALPQRGSSPEDGRESACSLANSLMMHVDQLREIGARLAVLYDSVDL